MARGLDKEQAAVNAGILDVALTLSSEFLAEVCGVLILDVLDNGVPADTKLAKNEHGHSPCRRRGKYRFTICRC